ncbi:MAG: hypothetical protein QHC90_25760 [Shinella sp.]|nr:hypothetical protein [Shinella sp.]
MIQYRRREPASVVPFRKRTSGFLAFRRYYSDVIREMGYSGETMTPEALALRGIPEHVQKRLARGALADARRRSISR